ncbi:MAG TPA: helix-hairpin-helix domain-containing protein [Methyloprofundus sp.]|uniref:ComEA family DNA-binding protein n=1 Tax=Methyloprofundus sp. TaxID=2020875 RepID=UPI0017E7C49C|nr:helix-hairpin-helix domain-containing protein [Methyloprofundus sp.]HIG65377.1 helix-hairpin-helix domain-containing protein [Methyloprofundus sp.]HIL77805.1 helix-hairpin-helix domain-containing protein [Methylococcales bacterium]
MRKLIIMLMFLSFSVFAEPVNINTANDKEISTALDGVGDKKAKEIVKYREINGAFKSINELSNVKGIGDKTIAKNKKNIKLK